MFLEPLLYWTDRYHNRYCPRRHLHHCLTSLITDFYATGTDNWKILPESSVTCKLMQGDRFNLMWLLRMALIAVCLLWTLSYESMTKTCSWSGRILISLCFPFLLGNSTIHVSWTGAGETIRSQLWSLVCIVWTICSDWEN